MQLFAPGHYDVSYLGAGIHLSSANTRDEGAGSRERRVENGTTEFLLSRRGEALAVVARHPVVAGGIQDGDSHQSELMRCQRQPVDWKYSRGADLGILGTLSRSVEWSEVGFVVCIGCGDHECRLDRPTLFSA